MSKLSSTRILSVGRLRRKLAWNAQVGERRSRRVHSTGVENQWFGARLLESMSQRGASGPTVQLAASRIALSTRSAVTAPGGPQERTQVSPESSRKTERRKARSSARQGHSGTGPATNRLAEAKAPPKYQSACFGGPRAVPSEAVAVDQTAVATSLEVLDDPLELETL